jgi:hypothetical protein
MLCLCGLMPTRKYEWQYLDIDIKIIKTDGLKSRENKTVPAF